MVDLTKKPFYLSESQILWVEETLKNMSLDEKLGQLMVLLESLPLTDEEKIKSKLEKSKQGGLRWQGGNKETVYKQNTEFQKQSKIPLLVACNCDDGGNGCLPEGTFVSTAAGAAAGKDESTAYHMGLVASREASSIACNWMFNPVVDIFMNWRNTIVNTRCFGDNAVDVIKNAKAFIRGVKDGNKNMAVCCKHFPGDGVEELDQHLVLGVNDLSVEEWENSFGRVYREMIEEGIESIMVGHIALPEMTRKLIPGIKDEDIMPASLAPELLNNLLREELDFNGVVITDATHMIGFSAMIKREDALPKAIASGCDMILFANDVEEDIDFLKKGIEKGILTEERVNDAVKRTLGLKAKIKLTEEDIRIPDENFKDKWVGCEEHINYRREAADKTITLVKDTKKHLPLNPEKSKRIWLVYLQTTPNSRDYKGDPVKKVIIEELEKAGFDVTPAPNFYDLEVENGPTPRNFGTMMSMTTRKEFTESYDAVMVFMNVKGYAQENNVRLRWSCHHTIELPWYISELPTIGVSLNFTNHLIDVPQIHTFINAYGSSRENISSAIEKICGKSEFKGTPSETVFCGRWDTRL